MTIILATWYALAAIMAQPIPPPADFVAIVLECHQPIVQPGRFVGCRSTSPDGELYFAGLKGRRLVTGP